MLCKAGIRLLLWISGLKMFMQVKTIAIIVLKLSIQRNFHLL